MKISVKIFLQDFFENFNLNIKDETLLDLKNYFFINKNIKINCQQWYLNDKKIDDDFKIVKGKYYIYIFDDKEICLKLISDNNIIKTPYISKYMKIKELKNILNIKNNIYLKNIKLKNSHTLDYYNIKNNSELYVSKKILIKN